MKKGVLLFSTGGTISSVKKEEDGTVLPTLSGQELVAALPGIEKVAVVDAKEFSKVPGHYLGFQEMLDLSGRIEDALSSRDYSGGVVTMGTNIIEEASYCLTLLSNLKLQSVSTGLFVIPCFPGPTRRCIRTNRF